MPRGGRRSGAKGGRYPNRSDLSAPATLPVQAAPSARYGERAAQEAAQRQIPMGRNPTPGPSGSGAGAGGTPPASAPPPPPPFNRPTERPDEPLTAGLSIGPGPGPEALGVGFAGQPDPVAIELRALYQQFPNDDLRDLIEDLDEGRSF